jgi:hypothetical protein
MVQHHARANAPWALTRHRGQPPRQLGYFFRTLKVATHAAVLGGLCEMLQVLPATAVGVSPRSFRSVTRGERLCQAFEIYCATVEPPVIQFEHAALLATALAHGEEISLQACPQCEARILVDHFGDAQEWSTHCRPTATLPAIPGRPTPSVQDSRWRRPHIQLKLFEPLDDEPRDGASADPLAGDPERSR